VSFEAQHALRGLDERTPRYIRDEVFAHGDIQVRMDAIEILRELDPAEQTVRALQNMLRLV